jgi:hypothetical protein
MAIIYSYPKKTTPNAGDFLVITDSAQPAPNKNRTKSLTVGDLASYVITSQSAITGGGTLNTIPLFTPDGQKIGDSIITQSSNASNVTITGNATVTSDLTCNNEILTDTLIVEDSADIEGQLAVSDTATFSSTSKFFGNVTLDDSGLILASSGEEYGFIQAGSLSMDFYVGDPVASNPPLSSELVLSLTDTEAVFKKGVKLEGYLKDGTGVTGAAGQVLSSTGTGVAWTSDGGGTVTGTGTPDSVAVFKTASEVYTPVNTTAIAGKSFLQKISQTNATIELGASTSFTDLNEGLEIYPNTTHFTTRVTPWLEIFAYEDPSANPLNTYDSAYDGSALVVGKSNSIGNASSSNLAIVGFNNILRGNKMMIVGQTNSVEGTNNTGSLVVGVSNGLPSVATLKNSLIAGQNIGVPVGTTAIIDASFITGRSNSAQGNISRSIIGGDDNDGNNISNAFISGVRNEIINGSNSTIAAGQNNTIGSVSSTNNNHNFIAGENNNLGTSYSNNKDSFILGRGNFVFGLIGGAFGSGNQVFSDTSAGTSIAIGQNNIMGSASGRVRNAIAIGTQNDVDNDYEIQIGRGLDSVTTSGNNHVLIGRNNDQNTDYDLSGINCSLVIGASTLGAAASRRNGLVITNKTAGSNESNVILPGVGKYRNYVDEAAAKAGGVPLYGLYHTDGVVHIVYTP